jgi:hypothetical protein
MIIISLNFARKEEHGNDLCVRFDWVEMSGAEMNGLKNYAHGGVMLKLSLR